MVNQKGKTPEISNSPDYLEILTPDQAMLILKSLINTDPKLKVEFEKLAKEIIETLNIDEIAEEIYSSLDKIDIDEVWHRAGRQKDGEYQDSYDIIINDIEDILEPFVRKIKSYIQQNILFSANVLCKGVLKGLHDFEKESGSEILNDLVDGLESVANDNIIGLWDRVNSIEDSETIDDFISKELPNWKL